MNTNCFLQVAVVGSKNTAEKLQNNLVVVNSKGSHLQLLVEFSIKNQLVFSNMSIFNILNKYGNQPVAAWSESLPIDGLYGWIAIAHYDYEHSKIGAILYQLPSTSSRTHNVNAKTSHNRSYVPRNTLFEFKFYKSGTSNMFMATGSTVMKPDDSTYLY